MMRTHKICFKRSIISFQIENNPIKIGADGMIGISTAFKRAGKLHSSFFKTIVAMLTVNFIINYGFQDIMVCYAIFELYLIVFYLNYIQAQVPKPKRTRQVT